MINIYCLLKAIEDAQTTVDERQLEADKAKERLDAAKVTLREQKRQVAVGKSTLPINAQLENHPSAAHKFYIPLEKTSEIL